MTDYVVFSTRSKRLYLGENNDWWSDLKKARRFSTERAAKMAVQKSATATDCETWEQAKKRASEK